MRRALQRRKVRTIGMIVLVPLLIAFGFGIYLASLAGELPWQSDPTRISGNIGAFEGLDVGTPRRTRAATPTGTSVASPIVTGVASVGSPIPSPTP